jgi:acetolactate synthase-1/2/3 large subunit
MEHNMQLSGAQALIKSLEHQGVDVIFGLPGGAILPVYDPLLESSIRHILVRHEQGAGHAAEGYAQATGRPGVAMVTSGPGATNIVTPLANAYMDSTPLVCITGQVPTTSIGTDAFQECDTTGITMGVTKHNWLVTDPAELPEIVAEAFFVATSGRPGPVLIDVPKDVAQAPMTWHEPGEPDLPGYRVPGPPEPQAVVAATELISSAARPVLYVGGGVVGADAGAELLALAELIGAPVVTTLMARGALPDSHRLAMGMPGMHGTYAAVMAMQRADLLVALGARFDDRVTGLVEAFAPGAAVIHVDIDPAEIGKVRRPDVGLVTDVKLAIVAIGAELRARASADPTAEASRREAVDSWTAQIEELQRRFPLVYDRDTGRDGQGCKPQMVIESLRQGVAHDTILVSGVGQHQMWAAQFFEFAQPRSWINSGGLGTMGFAIPAAIGAKVGRPDRPVWAIDGDGCFQMTAQELVTATVERIPIKVAILNNSYLGMVRQWQQMFYEERYSAVELPRGLPDFVAWAEAMGCVGLRASSADEVAPVIAKANGIDDRPVVVDFVTDASEQVYPMVPAGSSNDDIFLHPLLQGTQF